MAQAQPPWLTARRIEKEGEGNPGPWDTMSTQTGDLTYNYGYRKVLQTLGDRDLFLP